MYIFRKAWIVFLCYVIDAASIQVGQPEILPQRGSKNGFQHPATNASSVGSTEQGSDPETLTRVTSTHEGPSTVDIALIVIGCLMFLLAITLVTYMQRSTAKKLRNQLQNEIMHNTDYAKREPKAVYV